MTGAVLTAVAAKAGAVAPTDGPASVNERVAALRAKTVQVSGALAQDAVTATLDAPVRVIAWNDWRNG